MGNTAEWYNRRMVNKPTDIDEEHWNTIFKREKKNMEKNRYNRGQRKGNNERD